MNKIIITPLVFLLMSCALVGQNRLKNTVILYNVVPLRVDLNPDGTIQTIYGQDNKFLRGYTVVKPAKDIDAANTVYGNSLQDYSVISNIDLDLLFNLNKATLTQEIINDLDKAADMTFFENAKIVVNSYKVQTDNKSQTLYKNRMNALLNYLEIKNVTKDKIIINADELANDNEAFKITFVK